MHSDVDNAILAYDFLLTGLLEQDFVLFSQRLNLFLILLMNVVDFYKVAFLFLHKLVIH